MRDLSVVQQIAVWALPILFAVTLHEVAHGWVARLLGDRTAEMLGRLSLNPIKHVDPLGTVLIPLLLLVLGGFVFGWAKPVPVTVENLRNPKRDMALVAAAGPAANLVMAVIWGVLAKLGLVLGETMASVGTPMIYMGIAGVSINLVLMVLNLLPIPPLDGGRVLTGILPGPMAWRLSRIEPYGLVILLALLMTGILGYVLRPMVEALRGIVFVLVGL